MYIYISYSKRLALNKRLACSLLESMCLLWCSFIHVKPENLVSAIRLLNSLNTEKLRSASAFVAGRVS